MLGALFGCMYKLNVIMFQGAHLGRGKAGRGYLAGQCNQVRGYASGRDILPLTVQSVLDCQEMYCGFRLGAVLACVSSSGISLLARSLWLGRSCH